MTDEAILLLLEQRDESALRAIEQHYGGAGRNIASQLLGSEEDAQEIFQDTLLFIWNTIPPEHPENLYAYLCAVLRRLAHNRYRILNAKKRGDGQKAFVLDELREIIADSKSVEEIVSEHMLHDAVKRFLAEIKPDARTIFIQRYGNMYTIPQIANAYEITESKVKVSLMRTRKKLQAFLKKEGFI